MLVPVRLVGAVLLAPVVLRLMRSTAPEADHEQEAEAAPFVVDPLGNLYADDPGSRV
ncbi:MAG: hypothetical protein M3406_14265 [Chloroflexota bacterium]|nr:hypothetical protein [Chloroflexota bacterium]